MTNNEHNTYIELFRIILMTLIIVCIIVFMIGLLVRYMIDMTFQYTLHTLFLDNITEIMSILMMLVMTGEWRGRR